MGMYVLDVSSWQSVEAVANANVDGVIIKATQGVDYVNPKCNAQWDRAKQAGKLLGLYHYAATTDPIAEAEFFIKNIKNYVGKAILALDWEAGSNKAWGSTTFAKKFIDKVYQMTGVWCLLYTGGEGIKQCGNVAKTSGLWYAYYYAGHDSANEPWKVPNFVSNVSPWPTYTIWQFSSRGGGLDMNYAQLDKAGWTRLTRPGNTATSNNQSTTTTKPSTSAYSYKGKSVSKIAEDVIAGKVGSGDARKKTLGSYYTPVQAVVNYKTNNSSKDTAIKALVSATKNGTFGNGDARKTALGTFYDSVQASINGSSAKTYTVVAGDTLSAIGFKLGVNWTTLASKNNIKAPYVIRIGQRLKY